MHSHCDCMEQDLLMFHGLKTMKTYAYLITNFDEMIAYSLRSVCQPSEFE